MRKDVQWGGRRHGGNLVDTMAIDHRVPGFLSRSAPEDGGQHQGDVQKQIDPNQNIYDAAKRILAVMRKKSRLDLL